MSREIVTACAALSGNGSIRRTRAAVSDAVGQGAETAGSKEINKQSPCWYSRLLRNRRPWAETSMVIASSNQGICGGRTRTGIASARRGLWRRSRSFVWPFPLLSGRNDGAKCKATACAAEPELAGLLPLPLPNGLIDTTLANISGWPSISELSKGKVAQRVTPGACISWHGTSRPPREISSVLQTSVFCPKGVFQRIRTGRRSCAR